MTVTGEYGTSLRDLGISVLYGLAIAVMILILDVVAPKPASLDHRSLGSFAFAAVVGSLIPLVMLVSMLFRIRMNERTVQHVFLGKLVLKERTTASLAAARIWGGVFSISLEFSDGSRISTFMSSAEARRLVQDCTVASHNRGLPAS